VTTTKTSSDNREPPSFDNEKQVVEKQAWQENQIVSVLYNNASGAIVGNLINVSIVTLILYKIYPNNALLAWFGFGLILNIVRWYGQRQYLKNKQRLHAERWLQLHRFSTLLSGLHFGVLAVFFFSSEDPLYQALVIFVVGGSGAAAVGTHGVDLTTYRMFLLPGVIPLIARSLQEGTEVHNALSIMLTLLVVVMNRAAQQTRDTMLDNINMSYSLNYRATHDALVALLNREEFRKRFEESSPLLASTQVQTIIFIDLDNFKTVNDTYGHQAGDQALIQVGNVIRNSIRKSDIAARFGGDEFIILLRPDRIEDAIAVGQKILDAIDQFQHHQDQSINALGASIGIGYSSGAEVTFDALLKAADLACYKAKRENATQPYLREV